MSPRVANNWAALFLSGSILIGGAAFTCLAANLAPAVVAIALGGSAFSIRIGSTNFNELFTDQQIDDKLELLELLKKLESAIVELLATLEAIY